jgi:hypothetical protein
VEFPLSSQPQLCIHSTEACDILRLNEARVLTDLDVTNFEVEMEISGCGRGCICAIVCGAVAESVLLIVCQLLPSELQLC